MKSALAHDLANFTVIAAILPMAFAEELMGSLHGPIRSRQLGMLIRW